MKINLKEERTLDGFTYAAGDYHVGDEDAPHLGLVAQVTAGKLLGNFPVVCAEVKPKPARKRRKRTKKEEKSTA